MVKRKSPTRHKVRGHTRAGFWVRSFERGRGASRPKPQKRVGPSQHPKDWGMVADPFTPIECPVCKYEDILDEFIYSDTPPALQCPACEHRFNYPIGKKADAYPLGAKQKTSSSKSSKRLGKGRKVHPIKRIPKTWKKADAPRHHRVLDTQDIDGITYRRRESQVVVDEKYKFSSDTTLYEALRHIIPEDEVLTKVVKTKSLSKRGVYPKTLLVVYNTKEREREYKKRPYRGIQSPSPFR